MDKHAPILLRVLLGLRSTGCCKPHIFDDSSIKKKGLLGNQFYPPILRTAIKLNETASR